MRLLVFLVSIVMLLTSGKAEACSCVPFDPKSIDSVHQKLDSADIVFLGVVESVETEEPDNGKSGETIQTTTLYVLESWKGEKANRILMRINVQCCVCGFPFVEKEKFLIFGYELDDGFYSTSICSMSMPASHAARTIELLSELAAEE